MPTPEERLKEFVELTQPNDTFSGITNVEHDEYNDCIHIHFELTEDAVTKTCYARLSEENGGYAVDEFQIQDKKEESTEASDESSADSPVERLHQHLEIALPDSDFEGLNNLERTDEGTHIHFDLTVDGETTQYYALISEDNGNYIVEEFGEFGNI